MKVLVDEKRKLHPEFNPKEETHKIQNNMCQAGSGIDEMPVGTIVQSVPQDSIVKLQEKVLPEYRELAAKLIDHVIKEFEAQGGDPKQIREKFESMYKWTK